MTTVQDGRDFSTWLRGIARDAGLSDPERLAAALTAQGCHSTMTAVAAWLAGETEPSLDKMRAILRALHVILDDRDVWQDYETFVREEPPRATHARPGAQDGGLEEVLRANPSLPPGLSE
ncbi:MAG: helix-turn-helix domain-containing protein [Actinomycetota bacterium]